MVYFAPFLDANGPNVPSYQDVEDFYVSECRRIFGDDVYLENDSQDFQLIAAFSLKWSELAQALIQVYNARSPKEAIGVGLDGIVSVNGIRRAPLSYSTAPLTLNGTPFTQISNGIVTDTAGYKWALPDTVTVGSEGSVTVTGTCQTAGAITAASGTITIISTPVFGWFGVTNVFPATPGQPQENDTQLRYRQAVSVANPSQALKDGVLGAILDLPNVVAAQVYENDTNATLTELEGVSNPDGFPPHSMTAVVNGGDGLEIAKVIALRKTTGCYTNGDQPYTIPDSNGVLNTIRFFLPETLAIDVGVTIEPLARYSSAIGLLVQQAVINYLNSLTIGQSVIRSEVERAASSVNAGMQYPLFSLTNLTIGVTGDPLGTANLPMTYKQQPYAGSVSILTP